MTSLATLLPSDIERWRYENLLRTLTVCRALFDGHRVLDFEESWGMSAVALIDAGPAIRPWCVIWWKQPSG